MRDVLLDTNIVSALMVPDSPLYPRLRAVVQAGGAAFLSPVVDYEIRRGLIRKRAVSLSGRFELVANQLTYRDLDPSIWLRAAQLWAHSRDLGEPLPDADILIAAHGIELDATLVTDNVRHFEVFLSQGLRAENWVER